MEIYKEIKIDRVLDRLPTAKVIDRDGNTSIIEAEVYGDGIKMFLLSQGSWVKVLEPDDFVREMKTEIARMQALYCDNNQMPKELSRN